MHKSRDMSDLYAKIRRLIKEHGRWTDDIKDIKILFKNAIVSENISIQKAGLSKDSKIFVVFERNESAPVPEPVQQN